MQTPRAAYSLTAVTSVSLAAASEVAGLLIPVRPVWLCKLQGRQEPTGATRSCWHLLGCLLDNLRWQNSPAGRRSKPHIRISFSDASLSLRVYNKNFDLITLFVILLAERDPFYQP